ncbi:protein of unknown function, might belong to Acyltransferase [Moritella yayanosii]|uniref:Uncharacterized protein n=1 Tax=Moritella yayanosii TaxID=69539 RepID=A0A330LJN6_9GAMM|nr:protein of unknown function, might belong to Acyltransferase [Moritella yayanosii]
MPIILYCLDYKNKRVSIGDVIKVTGNIEKDLAAIENNLVWFAFYGNLKTTY